ncbi:unnamed protein product [Amoebophrya sp. A25]|nr:unnamed protein product [Amoebophrya sp. A25]|eukprot:GSA25T00005080001.1
MSAAATGPLIGWVGLGRMGAPMAAHIGKKVGAARLRAFDVSEDARRAFGDKFASSSVLVDNVRALRDCSIVFLSVPTSVEVAQVAAQLYDVEGAPELQVIEKTQNLDCGTSSTSPSSTSSSPTLSSSEFSPKDVRSDEAEDHQKLLVDCSSGDFESTQRIGAFLESQCGVNLVDCPVSGGPRGAEAGTLAAMIGASEQTVYERLDSLCSAFAQTNRVYLGVRGAGHAVKSINNGMNSAKLVMATEGVAALRSIGVSPATALDSINKSSGRSLQSMVRWPEEVLTGRYDYGFRYGLMHKDLRQCVSLFGKVSPSFASVLPYVEKVFAQAEEKSGGKISDDDYTRICQFVLDKATTIDQANAMAKGEVGSSSSSSDVKNENLEICRAEMSL